MAVQYTGKAISKGVSLPTDMWTLLEKYRQRTHVPVSRFIQDAVAERLMDVVECRQEEEAARGAEEE